MLRESIVLEESFIVHFKRTSSDLFDRSLSHAQATLPSIRRTLKLGGVIPCAFYQCQIAIIPIEIEREREKERLFIKLSHLIFLRDNKTLNYKIRLIIRHGILH